MDRVVIDSLFGLVVVDVEICQVLLDVLDVTKDHKFFFVGVGCPNRKLEFLKS